MTPRQLTLAQVQHQSEYEHARRLKAREDGDILYDPCPADIYIYKLEVSDRTDWHRIHSYSELFATYEAATRRAVENIRKRYLDLPGLNGQLRTLYDKVEYEELIDYVNTRLSFVQTITIALVRA
jgi:hypothetical protein